MDPTFHPGSTVPMPYSTHAPPNQATKSLHLADTHRPRFRRGTILIVDHDAAVRDALSFTLGAGGFGVRAFSSASALLSAGSLERDDCLLVEFDLEDMTGIELLTRLNARQVNLPAIIMSARLRPLVLEGPRPPQIAAILQKPFGQEALFRSLMLALGTP